MRTVKELIEALPEREVALIKKFREIYLRNAPGSRQDQRIREWAFYARKLYVIERYMDKDEADRLFRAILKREGQ